MKDYVIKKPAIVNGYPIHRAVAALTNGAPHLWRDEGDTLMIRTAAIIDATGTQLPTATAGELRLFKLRACVSSKVRGRHVYPSPGDHRLRQAWLSRQGLKHGFQIVAAHSTSDRVRVADQSGRDFTVDATDFTGVLKVTDPVAFDNALRVGIGSTAKAFGFSLLSI